MHPTTPIRPLEEFDSNRIEVSFELFPAKTPGAGKTLEETVRRLASLEPRFFSVTYGAGGSTQTETSSTLDMIRNEVAVPAAGHLTCVGASRADTAAMVERYRSMGIKHIVALRGDPSGGLDNAYCPHPEGYANAAALVAGIRSLGDFEISVAAYPEKHPESSSVEADLAMLGAKVENGATRAITQFFFDNAAYYRYVDRVRARGIDVPIVPGIVPITNFERVCAFARKCGATIPRTLVDRFAGLEGDPETMKLVAAAVAAEQVAALRDQGVRHFHFYTLNRADLAYAICRLLGVGPKSVVRQAA
nr:methylenetetrahydrofolate reductase [NAD(P)H] [Rhodoligotrophos appendicifer]